MGEILKELPAVILRGSVLLPGVVSHFDISTQRSIHAVEAAMNGVIAKLCDYMGFAKPEITQS